MGDSDDMIEADHHVLSGEPISRGWSMRKGRCNRLAAPKRGKAADHAAALGQGREVHRGRSVFKRSANNGSRKCCRSPDYLGKYGGDYPISRRRAKLRRHVILETEEAFRCKDERICGEPSFLLEDDDSVASIDEWEFIKPDAMSDSQSTWSWEEVCSFQSDESSSASWTDIISDVSESVPALSLGNPTLWELALARAEAAAQHYDELVLALGTHAGCDESAQGLGRRKRQQRKVLRSYKEDLVKQLFEKHNIYIRGDFVHQKSNDSFEHLRMQFFEQHAMDFCQRLRPLFSGAMSLKPTPLAPAIRNRFDTACKDLPGQLKPAFHGTDHKKLESIYRSGLVIPGQGNSIPVANGQAHGRGIYIATLENPMLSWGFSRGASRPMLVCGVLDDAEVLGEAAHLGALEVKAESSNVRHVGNAMVVFDAQRVAPLFEVTHRWVHEPKQYTLQAYHHLPKKQHSHRRIFARKIQRRRARIDSAGAVAFLSRRAAQKRQ